MVRLLPHRPLTISRPLFDVQHHAEVFPGDFLDGGACRRGRRAVSADARSGSSLGPSPAGAGERQPAGVKIARSSTPITRREIPGMRTTAHITGESDDAAVGWCHFGYLPCHDGTLSRKGQLLFYPPKSRAHITPFGEVQLGAAAARRASVSCEPMAPSPRSAGFKPGKGGDFLTARRRLGSAETEVVPPFGTHGGTPRIRPRSPSTYQLAAQVAALATSRSEASSVGSARSRGSCHSQPPPRRSPEPMAGDAWRSQMQGRAPAGVRSDQRADTRGDGYGGLRPPPAARERWVNKFSSLGALMPERIELPSRPQGTPRAARRLADGGAASPSPRKASASEGPPAAEAAGAAQWTPRECSARNGSSASSRSPGPAPRCPFAVQRCDSARSSTSYASHSRRMARSKASMSSLGDYRDYSTQPRWRI